MKRLRRGGYEIAKIHQLTGRIFARKLKQNSIEEINPAQGRIMVVLWQQDGISIQELARITSLGKSTLTSMLDRLEEAGYIQRVPCAQDRRKILIYVTQRDQKVRDVYEQVVREVIDIYYKGFSQNEIETFEKSLSRVFKNLEEYEQQN